MQISNPFASFTRPANTTAYATGQLVANAVAAGSVVPMQFSLDNGFPMGQFRLTRARLVKSGPSITNATFRLHLFQALPALTAGDGVALASTGALAWLGNIDVTTMFAFNDGAAGFGAAAAGSEMFVREAPGNGINIYGLLVALGAYTPISGEIFTVTLEPLEAY